MGSEPTAFTVFCPDGDKDTLCFLNHFGEHLMHKGEITRFAITLEVGGIKKKPKHNCWLIVSTSGPRPLANVQRSFKNIMTLSLIHI